MASLNLTSQSQSLFNKTHLQVSPSLSLSTAIQSGFVPKTASFQFQVPVTPRIVNMPLKAAAIVSSTTAEKPQKRYPGEAKGFVEEMRFVAMKLHTREQAKEGEKEVEKPEERAVPKWEPSVEGYLRFLVDSKLVYDTLESIVDKAAYSFCEFCFA
ncbi:heme oxygenase 1, chloroplastic-like [Hevea brasiliensis]|uniref:heme oxygenase 1, chloroplastic-like n=1 Tax=Hevea brasiliensis TaxID=3981 RepID=UPI0025E06E69|nr:heme oxygenase 1, chloroplastic-like [Hevea brasiliensis]